MIIFLRFPDEETTRAIMYEYLSDTGDWLTNSHSHTLDILGTICRPTGNMLVDETGMEYQELAPIAGFHVNFIGELPVGAYLPA